MADPKQLLDEALARGVISDEQRAQLAAISAEERNDNEERIKPVGTFNEIFVTFGVVLLLNAISGIVMLITRAPLLTLLIGCGVAWGTGLYFHERKRFRLPIIYACISAASNMAFALHQLFNDAQFFDTSQPLAHTVIPLAMALWVLAAGAWRFRIPFLMLPISILFTVIITYAARYADDDISYKLILGFSGLAILAVAVRFDLQDPQRITRASDFAFWSYVVGSPLFVHSLFLSILIEEKKEDMLQGPEWLLIAVLALAVSFAGLLLNRRALILSTLIYVGFVLFRLLSSVGGSSAAVLLITALLIGLYVISLGSRWTHARHYLMSHLPPWPWLKRLPPY